MSSKQTKPHGPQGPAYTVKITCGKRGCKEVRWIKPQDQFQTKFCAEHQKEAARARTRERAKAKRAAAAAAKPAKTTKATAKKTSAKKAPKLTVVKGKPSTAYERAVEAVAA